MKAGYIKLLDAISALDPAASKLVKEITLHLANGRAFRAGDVAVSEGIVFARRVDNADQWAFVPKDEVVWIEADIDREACEKAKIEPTLAAVLQRRADA